MDETTNRSSGRSKTSTLAKAELIKRQMRMLFSAYRRDDFADPEGFLAQLGVVLEGYTEEVIKAVTDPRTGIQRRIKFPPTIAEIVEACDAECVAINTRERYAAMPTPRPIAYLTVEKRPGRRANLFIQADAPQYAQALEWTRTADEADWKYDEKGRAGIWVSLNWHTMIAPKKGLKSFKPMTDEELRARYSRQQEAAE